MTIQVQRQDVEWKEEPPTIKIPIESVVWLTLSILCWCTDSTSTVAIVTTFHLLVQIYLDRRIQNTPSSSSSSGVTEHDQQHDNADIAIHIWRNSTLSNTSTTTSCDSEGKYMSITLIPILLESMNILSKQQQQQKYLNNLALNNTSNPLSSSLPLPLYNAAFIVSILQVILWNSKFMNHALVWTQRKSLLYSLAFIVLILLLILSFTDAFPSRFDDMWFCYVWIGTLFLCGPFQHLSLQGIMTYGEWLVISCCFAFIGTIVWTALLKDMIYLLLNDNATSDRNCSPSTMIYAYTATAGLFGCIVACSTVNILFQYTKTNQILQTKYPSIIKYCHYSIITNLLRVIYISFITLGIVECTFWNSNLTPQHSFPKCLWWILYDFLLETEYVSLEYSVVPQYDYITRWLPIVKTLPRISWLMYWFTTMLATIPLAPTTGRISPVIARKWFHFIAILLFVPTTILVPQLQSLSYAVAICVLLIVEVIRIDIPMLNDFYYTYLDQTKDEADDQKFVISHIALVAGCATPLWIIQYYNFACVGENSINSSRTFPFNALVGLWGVWVLGIGDAMGAIVGKSIGRYKWGSNSRTIEGSMAMCFSLCISCISTVLLCASKSNSHMNTEMPAIYSFVQWLPAVLFVTLIEAYTLQIDNIVLPFAGVAMILVTSTSGFLE